MRVQHKYPLKHLAIAIALTLSCAEFSNAQPQPEQASAPPEGDPITRLTTVTKSESSKNRADGGGDSFMYLDSTHGYEPSDTYNFNGLFRSQGAWTLTDNGEFKEGIVVQSESILTNNGKIQGGTHTFGQLFNKGDIKGHVQVEEGGTFAGSGNVGSLGVHGRVNVNGLNGAPSVKGNLSLFETAVLAYEVNPDGRAETIKVGGTASLGGATLKIEAVPGDYPSISQYTIIEAKKVEGTFGEVLHDLAYMEPSVQYTKKTVGLTYARNGEPIAGFAASGNAEKFGKSVAEPQSNPQPMVPSAPSPVDADEMLSPIVEPSAEGQEPTTLDDTRVAEPDRSATVAKTTTPTNAAITALLGTNKATAALALEQLAGSSNANLAKATLSSVDPVSGSMLLAMRQLDSAGGANAMRHAPRQAAGSADNGRVWLHALGHGGKLDREIEPLQHSTKGLLMGADWSLDEEWRLGVMGGKSRTRLDSRELEGGLDSWHLGAYALRQSGPMSLRLGATYSNHGGNTVRRVVFTGFSDRPEGRYDASTQQAFAEVGYNLGRANTSIEPFASLGIQRYQRDGYTEKGGAASLKVNEQAKTNLNSTLGLRVAKVDTLSNGMRLTPRFSAGWKHTYGDVLTKTSQRLVTGGREYTVYGVELDRDSLLVDAGLDVGVSKDHSVGVGLTSEIGSDSRNHGVMGQWRMAF